MIVDLGTSYSFQGSENGPLLAKLSQYLCNGFDYFHVKKWVTVNCELYFVVITHIQIHNQLFRRNFRTSQTVLAYLVHSKQPNFGES